MKVGSNADTLDFTGKIVGIDPKIDPTTRLVSVRAEVDNPDHKLTPGQFVQARVELPEESNVIALPQTSIVSSLYGDYVYVVRPEQKQERREGERSRKGARGPETGGAAGLYQAWAAVCRQCGSYKRPEARRHHHHCGTEPSFIRCSGKDRQYGQSVREPG